MMFQTILAACLLNGVAAQLKQCDQGGCQGVDNDDDVTSLLMTYANVQTRGISGTYSFSVDGDTGEVQVDEKGGSGTITNGEQCPDEKQGKTVACKTAFKVSGNKMVIENPDAAGDDDEGTISGDTITWEGGTVWTKRNSLMQTDMDIEENSQVALAAPHKFGSLSKAPAYAVFLRGSAVTMGALALAGIGTFSMMGTAIGGVLGLIPTAVVTLLKAQMSDRWSCAKICPMNQNTANEIMGSGKCSRYESVGDCSAIGSMSANPRSTLNSCMAKCLNWMGLTSKAKLTAISVSQCACFKDAHCQINCLGRRNLGSYFEMVKKEV